MKLLQWVERAGGCEFGCTRCGQCCEGTAGYVWLEQEDIERLCTELGLEWDSFGRAYVRNVKGALALVDSSEGNCVFWRGAEEGCGVYGARPEQCRTYPFWPEVIKSEAKWRAEAKRCPGIAEPGAFARWYEARDIETLLTNPEQADEVHARVANST